jgi:hypothetical protein
MMTKEERLQYIKKAAAKVRREKAHIAEMYDLDQDTVKEVFEPETDFLSIENMQGFVMTGVQKVAGGLRRMPVIIL